MKCFDQHSSYLEHYVSILPETKVHQHLICWSKSCRFFTCLLPLFAFVISLVQNMSLPDYIWSSFHSHYEYLCFVEILTCVYITYYVVYAPDYHYKPKRKFWILKLICCQGIHISDINLNLALWTGNFVGFYVKNQVISWFPTQRAYVSKLFRYTVGIPYFSVFHLHNFYCFLPSHFFFSLLFLWAFWTGTDLSSLKGKNSFSLQQKS